MSEQDDPAQPGIHAENHSNVIGNISARDINAPIISGNENKVEITYLYEASEDEAPLSSYQIEHGLELLEGLLLERAPILKTQFTVVTKKLRATLGPDLSALSPALKKQHEEQLDAVKAVCQEVADMSFHALCTGQNPPPYDPRCPFRGLESFRPEDCEFFFGREQLREKLFVKVQAGSFLAVLGASGSGKSSLVMAGLVPALGLDYAIFHPGSDPLGGLKAAREKPLIVIDQFEELFTLTRDKATQNIFITALLAFTQKVIITMRSDFLGEVALHRELNERIQTHLENIPPMSAEELRRAMEKQADQVGLRFEGDLSEQILEDVQGEPGAMPLLQHALWELWNRRHGRHLLPEEYRAFGGVRQAITRTAEELYGKCTQPEQEQIRDIFLQLTHIDERADRRDTRRRVLVDDLPHAGQSSEAFTLLLDKLATARLIVQTPNDKRTEVEVAHEALIQYWERLRKWIDDNRNDLIFHRQLVDDASQWDQSGRDPSYLYRDTRLLDTEQWAKSNTFRLGLLDKEFLRVGRARRNAERQTTFLRRISLGIAGASLLIIVFAFIVLGPDRITNWMSIKAHPPLDMDWVTVLAGEFSMGSEAEENERPVHKVDLDSFEIGQYEVTNEQYLECVKAKVCSPPRNEIYELAAYSKHPVTNIGWAEAVKFCQWTVPERYIGYLPTEAQWEKSARGTDERTYPWGEEIGCQLANYLGCVNDTTPVDTYEAGKSPYGAYDMAGNVWEWVADWYDKNYYTAFMKNPLPNPTGPEPTLSHVLRGGSWERHSRFARSAYREWNEASAVGFRCARSLRGSE